MSLAVTTRQNDVPRTISSRHFLPTWLSPAVGCVDWLIGFDQLERIYASAAQHEQADSFAKAALRAFRVDIQLDEAALERIPREGPVIVVANHPLGAIDGLAMLEVVKRLRPDVKLVGNRWLQSIPQLRDDLVPADVFGDARANAAGLRAASRWLEQGHALALFPAGEVSSFQPRSLQVADRAWSRSVGWLARKLKVSVVPIWFDGRNSPLFNAAGLLHPMLRTILLPREALRQRGRSIAVKVGPAISRNDAAPELSDNDFSQLLRARTRLLAHAESAERAPVIGKPLANAVCPQALEAEVNSLAEDARYAASGNLVAYIAATGAIPLVLQEIGRLREKTFRKVGEGTGEPVDIDIFDHTYLHLFIWHKTRREIVGSYRLGLTDELLSRQGPEGLYTSTLFDYKPELLRSLSPAIELGRSFVREEYQREYAPLLMLWKAIGQFVVRNPRYKTLFGTVSISNEYKSLSRELLMRFLLMNNRMCGLATMVRPKNPPRFDFFRRRDTQLVASSVRNVSEMDALIAEVEGKCRGMPVLVRQYLRLGARLLAFNVDPGFSDVLDGLVMVDLTRIEPALLTKYMGREGYASFMRQASSPAREQSRAG